ncbi:MAG: sigma-70 family RNA polymerase sigma factor [Myxococcaceae bacterium]
MPSLGPLRRIPLNFEALLPLLESARAAWPALQLDDGTFLECLAEKASAAPESLFARDLYLACACLNGRPGAASALEATVLSRLDRPLRRMGLSEEDVVDTKQKLLSELLVSAGDRPPRLAEYAGRGSLVDWVRVIGIRQALRLRGRSEREVPAEEEELIATPASELDPELAFLKSRYRAEFSQAFRAALTSMAPKEQNLLRYSYVDGLSLEQIAELYKVHRATVARWLASARLALLEQTLNAFRATAQISAPELASIVRLLRSQVDLSIRQVLTPRENGG